MSSKGAPSNWDPILLISQIVSMQCLHYLTLAVLTPPLLAVFAEPVSLSWVGGAANIGMLMDWREMAGRPTAMARGSSVQGDDRWRSYTQWAWSGGERVAHGWSMDRWDGSIDPIRGWVIAACWIAACGADIYYLYTLIRRPRLILDFSLTLVFNHLVLTTYYSAALPTSLFFWAILLVGALISVVSAEQLCVKREMSEGLNVSAVQEEAEELIADELELGSMRRRD
ncbi:hypothetical protein EYR40_008464 [Pleurotus pulmonarius]|nr:hypothetical protein EYR36_009282 [Pleurotus pulmonarius]KAF4592782.1 hypothetical protein EYR38_008482 [Pleurotus pulmonarius]KAF4593676.1 hypothetical protein EYR40_008464 [Pleurotus pulmonarius]